MFCADIFGALKPGFGSLATLKLVVNVVDQPETEKNSCGIARFPCDSTAFLLSWERVGGWLEERSKRLNWW